MQGFLNPQLPIFLSLTLLLPLPYPSLRHKTGSHHRLPLFPQKARTKVSTAGSFHPPSPPSHSEANIFIPCPPVTSLISSANHRTHVRVNIPDPSNCFYDRDNPVSDGVSSGPPSCTPFDPKPTPPDPSLRAPPRPHPHPRASVSRILLPNHPPPQARLGFPLRKLSSCGLNEQACTSARLPVFRDLVRANPPARFMCGTSLAASGSRQQWRSSPSRTTTTSGRFSRV